MADYDAFISYSHSKDKPIAAALQSVMQRLGKPWYRRRSLRVFRDDTSLAVTPHLWPTIEQSLRQSRYLILLASPEASASSWVGKEVAFWLDHKNAETLLIAVTDGELSWNESAEDFQSQAVSPLPSLLKGKFPSEPKWVDLRAYRAGANQRDPKFMDLCADFAAAIHGVPKEDLLSQEIRQQRRALMLAWSAMSALLLFLGVAVWNWKAAVDAEQVATEQKVIAQVQRETAQSNFKIALSAAEKNIRLVPDGYLTGKINVDLARTLLDISSSTLSTLNETQEGSDIAQVRLHLFDTFAETYVVLGDVRKALTASQNGLDIAVRLAEQAPNDNDRQHFLANSHARLGDARAQAGDPNGALEEFEKFLMIVSKLDRDYVAASDQLQRDLWRTHERIGDALQTQNKLLAAQTHYEAMLQISLQMQDRKPSDKFWEWSETIARENNGDIRRVQGDFDGALTHFTTMESKCAKLVDQDPSNARWAWTLSLAHERVGDIHLKKGDYSAALAKYREFLKVVTSVAVSDPSHATRQRGLAIAHERLGDALIGNGEVAAALDEYKIDHRIAIELSNRDPANNDFKRDLAIAKQKIGDALYSMGKIGDALASYKEYQKIASELVATDLSNADLRLDFYTSHQRLGTALKALGNFDAARDEFQKCRSGTIKTYDPRNLWPPFYSPGTNWPRGLHQYCEQMIEQLNIEPSSRTAASPQ